MPLSLSQQNAVTQLSNNLTYQIMYIPTATRADLEVAILQNNLEDTERFGGIENIMKMSIEEIREKLTEWIFEGDETFQF